MADDESFSFDSLSKMKVSELREICKNSQLLISGNKAELIVRILENPSTNQEDDELFLEEDMAEINQVQPPVIETKDKIRSSRDIDDAIDRLISRVDIKESITIPSEEITKNEVMVAEILEAEIFEEPTPSVDKIAGESLILDEEDSWGSTEFTDTKKDFIDSNEDIEKPSLTITLPSLDIFKTYWPQISAVFVVILLVGAGVFYFLSSDSSFQARPLNYEDSMTFTLSDGLIDFEGDEMVSLLRDVLPDTAIQDACNRLTVNIGGTGSIEIIKGNDDEITHPVDKTVTDLQGTVSAKDAYGRSHLTVQQRVTHSLTVDLEGKTWKDRSTNVCGNLGWSLSGNQLEMTTDIYDELAEHSLLRSESAISFTDIDNVRTNANIVTFGVDGFSNLDGIATLLTFPLTPIELHEFFGDIKLESGMKSEDLSDWNKDWKWSVGIEQRKEGYGLVYPVEITHTEVERCLGRMNIDILVKNGVPWPVEQIVDVLIDKDQSTSDCSFIESTATDAALPEGTLRINMKMSEITSDSGTKSISWGSTYVSRPGPGEDKLSESAKKDWSTAMWDESEIRSFSLEDATNCLRANHTNRDITVAIDSEGYIWQAIYSYNEDDNGGFEEWNLSWVRSDETSGWAIVRQNDGCSFESERRNDGEITWNQDAIPSTHTLKNLEDRILDDNRYQDLQVSHDLVGTTYGYRLSVSEENDLLSFLPGDLTEGQVLVVGSREWTDSNREHSVNFAMDAQNGRMLAWAEVIG